MRKHLIKKSILIALLPALSVSLFAGCGASGSDNASSGSEKMNYHNASFSLDTEAVENEEVTFNGITFEISDQWRKAEENGDTLYYTTDDDKEVIRVHTGSADQEYDSQQKLVNAMYEEITKERTDAGCYIESIDINIGGHRGKWFRSDVNYISEDGKPIDGYEQDASMDGYLRECVLYAADKQNYVLLEATYPMGSFTEDQFQVFYKSPHYHSR